MQASSSQPPLRRTKNLSQELADLLEAQIRNGTLAPGAKLPSEAQIIKAHGVSRTVVREALSNLQASGKVTTRQGIGTFVCQPSTTLSTFLDGVAVETLDDVISVIEVRVSLESEAAALAAQRRTPAQLGQLRRLLDQMQEQTAREVSLADLDMEFHLVISQATGNRYLTSIMSSLGQELVPRIRLNNAFSNSPLSQLYLKRRDAEHEDIYNAIARQDAIGAAAAMRLHLTNSRERLIKVINAYG
ncbi:DNA-binding FadR family transcriptional regulator [Pseudomonas duriflava]|uniref:DNA-binding FadR family transcriptional regulator n=1 Tax=Pseudomonas duriflava TaxID=459528 RepID=A0A562PT51_9PSED|nr:FadR/GntR family transcriptional regulator [Pseudomonas duriflava]TWI47256.1 DNA-binding FadR family transcriptional regulator [Pseudomonas duriflava]